MARGACRSVLLALLVAGTGIGTARAHPLVDRARAQYVAADFESALETLEQAAAARDLVRGDVLRLLETRALVHAALEDAAQVDGALLALASLDPDYELAAEVPPELRRRFVVLKRRLRGRLRLDVHPRHVGGSVVLEGQVEHDPAQLVRSILTHTRAGSGPWRTSVDRPAILEAPADRTISYWAKAIGPGGAALATLGSAEDPLRLAPEGAAQDDDEASAWPWIAVGAGATVVAGVVVALILLASSGSQDIVTEPGSPTIRP